MCVGSFIANLGKLINQFELCFLGTVLSLKGAVLTFGCLSCTGTLIHPPYETWRDPNSTDESERTRKRKLVMHSPCSSQDMGDHQFAVVCSEKQAKVFSLPSQICLYVHNITDTSFLLRADVVTMCNNACLACFSAHGHIMILRYLKLLSEYYELFPIEGKGKMASTVRGDVYLLIKGTSETGFQGKS